MARIAEFWLSSPNPDDAALRRYNPLTGREGEPVRYNNFTGIKSEDIINDPRKEVYDPKTQKYIKNNNFGKQTKIRLAEGEPSIFVDEQSDGDIRLVRLGFTSGHLMVDLDQEPAKAEFLRVTNVNKEQAWEDKDGNIIPVVRRPNRRVVFFELNKKKLAKDEVDRDIMLADAITKIKSFGRTELIKYGRVLGIDTDIDRDTEELRRDMIMDAKYSPDDFFDLIEDESYVDAQDAIYTGVENGIILSHNDGSFQWYNAGIIYKPSKGEDPIESFTDFLVHTEDGKAVYRKLMSLIGRDAEIQKDEEVPEVDIVEMEDFIEGAIEAKVIEYRFPKGFYFEEELIAKKKQDTIKSVLNSKVLYDKIKSKSQE